METKEVTIQMHDVNAKQSNDSIKDINKENKMENMTFAWKDLGYSVPDSNAPNGVKQILKGLNGFVPPQSSIAILGASGAGKSTFLDVIAGRKDPNEGKIEGQVLINGRSDINLNEITRYCTQDDALYGWLTVQETMMYSAKFQITDPNVNINEKVDHMLKLFGLDGQRDTIIGNPILKGCSGGQIRRVSVACQCLGMDGGILFLDEPTSGLDSVAAYEIISRVKTMCAETGASLIATIHQPSTETFNLFTHVLLLGAGSTVFFGSVSEAIDHFAAIGYPIPSYCNPADEFLRLTNIDFSSNCKDEELKRVKNMCSSYESSKHAKNVISQIETEISHDHHMDTVSHHIQERASFAVATETLVRRALLNALKNPLAYWVRVVMYTFLAVLMGTTWVQMDASNQKTIQDRMAAIFFSVAFLSFMAVAGIPAFLEERLVFMRETSNRWYSIEAYMLSNTIISAPFIFLISICFSLVAYLSMNLNNTVAKFFSFTGYLFLALMVAEAQTVFISVLIPIFVVALTLTAFMNGLWMVVQGFFIQRQNLPAFWRYSFHYMDFQKYAFECLIKNEFTDSSFNCENTGSSCFCLFQPSVTSSCTFTGDNVLNYYGYTDISYQNWGIILGCIYLIFRFSTYAILKIRTRA